MTKAIGPKLPAKVSPGVLAGGTLFATNIPADVVTGVFVGGGIEHQARHLFACLKAMCEEAGGTMADVVQVTVFLIDKADAPGMNVAYNEAFNTLPYPTRATVVVKELLGPPGMLIETTALAAIGRV